MKHITIILSLLLIVSCKPTFSVVEQATDYSTVIKRGRVTGVIFDENGDCFMCLQDKKRFTPSIADIEKTEQVIRNNIEQFSKKVSKDGNCPRIHKNINSYRRQYFGYIDNEGHQVIYTTFNWDRYILFDNQKGKYKSENESWKEEREVVFDGCSLHWEVKVNLITEKLFDFGVNGLG